MGGVRLGRLSPAMVDRLLAGGLAGLGLVDLAVDTGAFRGPATVSVAFLLATSLPLAWRRRAPLAVLAIVAAAAAAWQLALYFPQPQPPIEPFLGLLVAIYALAVAADRRRALVGGAVAAAYLLIVDVPTLLAGRDPGDVLPAWLFFALAAILGRATRRRQLLAAALAERTEELERERDERARLAVALERARIARELHDVITHRVSGMVVQAGVERRLLADAQAATRDALQAIEHAGREALTELRRLLGVLRKPDDGPGLAPHPTLGQLDALLAGVRATGLPVEQRIKGTPVLLPAGVDLSAYRIIQEALTNTRKPAGPANARVVVTYRADELRMEITDDGAGPTGTERDGHGLVGMRERAALCDGALETGGGPAGGYRVCATLKLHPASA